MQYLKSIVILCEINLSDTDVFLNIETLLKKNSLIRSESCQSAPSLLNNCSLLGFKISKGHQDTRHSKNSTCVFPYCSKRETLKPQLAIIAASEVYCGENALYEKDKILHISGKFPKKIIDKDAYIQIIYSDSFVRVRFYYIETETTGRWFASTLNEIDSQYYNRIINDSFDVSKFHKNNVYVFDILGSTVDQPTILFRFCLKNGVNYTDEHNITSKCIIEKQTKFMIKPLLQVTVKTELHKLAEKINEGIGFIVLDSDLVYSIYLEPIYNNSPTPIRCIPPKPISALEDPEWTCAKQSNLLSISPDNRIDNKITETAKPHKIIKKGKNSRSKICSFDQIQNLLVWCSLYYQE
jgi:hypothetical protein